MGKELAPSAVPTIRELLEQNREAMEQSLPKHIPVDRLMRICLTQLVKNPTLQECTKGSVVGSLLQSALWGLEPDGDEAALVPYRIKGVMTCTLQPGYKGLIKLSHRTEQVQLLYAEVVKQNDKFSIVRGLRPNLIHEPLLIGDRGAAIGAYAVYHNVNGGVDFEWMNLDEINKVRASSKSAQKADSPWNTWPEEMYKKTVIKRFSKRLPKSAEMKMAVQQDHKIENRERIVYNEMFKDLKIAAPEDIAGEDIEEPQRISQSSEDKETFADGIDTGDQA